jgi:hypothetical protein
MRHCEWDEAGDRGREKSKSTDTVWVRGNQAQLDSPIRGLLLMNYIIF